ncbi:MAG: hypothetical protein ACYCWE_11070 [Eubacteriales bacterium]
MKDKVFIIIVCSILLLFSLSSPIIAFLSSVGVLDALKTKNYIITEKVYEADMPGSVILNKVEQGKTLLENVYINCIPFYGSIVSSVQSVEVSMLSVTDSFIRSVINRPKDNNTTQDTDVTENKDEETSVQIETEKPDPPPVEYYSMLMWGDGRPYFYAIEPLKVMERVEGASDAELQMLTEMQLGHIHRLKEATPELNYYVYMGTRIQETGMYDEMITGPSSTVKYFNYFKENLDSDIKFDYFRLDTPEDRINKKFRSDHHWNIYGAYEGYKQIINMMYESTPEIGAPVEYDVIQVPGIKWLGSIGSTVGQTDIGYLDDFYILDLVDLPEYSGNNYDIKGLQESFLSGEFNKFGENFDYYVAYNQPQDKYVFDGNHSGRNLLILGDSYSWSVSAILASHFDTTICHIQPWTIGNNVTYDYRQLIAGNNITDVLIFLYSSRLLFGYDTTDFGRMLTE